jgi:hypothetical protein
MELDSLSQGFLACALMGVVGLAIKGIDKIETDRLNRFRQTAEERIDFDFYNKIIPDDSVRSEYISNLEKRKIVASEKYKRGYSAIRALAWYSFLGIFTLITLSLIIN